MKLEIVTYFAISRQGKKYREQYYDNAYTYLYTTNQASDIYNKELLGRLVN